MNFLERVVLGNSVLDWVLALGVAFGCATVLWIMRSFVLRRLRRATAATGAVA